MIGNRLAQWIGRRRMQRAVERLVGLAPAVSGFGAQRVASILISDFRGLPVLPGIGPIQNTLGQYLFLPDYSAVGGPDVLE